MDRGEKLSRAMTDLVDTFESFDNQQFMASGLQEWREFYTALEKVWILANRMDSGL